MVNAEQTNNRDNGNNGRVQLNRSTFLKSMTITKSLQRPTFLHIPEQNERNKRNCRCRVRAVSMPDGLTCALVEYSVFVTRCTDLACLAEVHGRQHGHAADRPLKHRHRDTAPVRTPSTAGSTREAVSHTYHLTLIHGNTICGRNKT